MTITVKYLASLAEALGKDEEILTPEIGMTVQSVWECLNPQHPIKANTISAINHEFSQLDEVVTDGDELAFFPPVTGGWGNKLSLIVEIIADEFQPFELLTAHQTITPNIGAQSVFVGYMRDFREDNTVQSMRITHYSPMTENHLEKLGKQIMEEYKLISLYIAHRVGDVFPTSPLVVISATASHRSNAITATSELLEALKHNVPLWKKEYNGESNQWVDSNTSNAIQ